jgi:ATP-dependent Clp protease ATP-binding subunit ClpA
MTSNLGATEMNGLVDGGLGFAPKAVQVDNSLDDKITRSAVDAARRKFAPEFMNRIDKVVVFRMLREEHMRQILDIELGMVQQRVLMAAGANQFVFTCTAPVKEFLLAEGTDAKYGARHLKRAIERHLVFPLANLVATAQVRLGDFVRIDMDSGCMTFVKEAEGAVLPGTMERFGTASASNAQAVRTARTLTLRREFGAGQMPENK